MRFAGKVGKLVADFSGGRIESDSDLLIGHLESIFRALIAAANDAGVNLADTAQGNLEKIFDHWPGERTYPQLFDKDDDPGEQIP